MVVSVQSAGFLVQPDGVWLHVEAPDGRRAAINLAEIVGDTSEVAVGLHRYLKWPIVHLISTNC